MRIGDGYNANRFFVRNDIIQVREKEKMLNNQERTISDQINNPSSAFNAEDLSEYVEIFDSNDGKVVRKAATSVVENQRYQSQLSALGFYSGPIDGVLTSSISQKAIKNFQHVYGLTENGNFTSMTKKRLKSVYSKYESVYGSTQLATLSNSANFKLDSTERANFARIWTFLRIGMGASAKQASGIMGNLYAESRFSSDNANGYSGDHNPSYSFSSTDKVA